MNAQRCEFAANTEGSVFEFRQTTSTIFILNQKAALETSRAADLKSFHYFTHLNFVLNPKGFNQYPRTILMQIHQ